MIIATVAGNSCKDATTREAGSSTVTGFSIAGETGFGDRKQTHFFSCSIWGARGVALEQHILKGSKLTVTGEYSEREYEGKVYKEINVTNVALQGGGQGGQQQAPQQTASQGNGGGAPIGGDEVPFAPSYF